MNRSEDHKDAGLQEEFSVLSLEVPSISHHTKCGREEVQRAATITTPRKRPRPGRRRLSSYHLPLSLTQISLFVTLFLSVLCMPTEAAEHPGSQSRAVKDHFVDGRIMFDHKHAPQPALHRRNKPESTNTASTITTAEAAVTSSTSDYSTPTTISLPRAFDGGFGTNYTQPSCPTFLRSMVNNDTFISCVPFSLLLQVRHLQKNSPPQGLPRKLTCNSPELHVLLRRHSLPLHHHRRPQRLLFCHFPRLLNPHVLVRPHPPLLHGLPRRLQKRKPPGPPSLRRSPRL